MDAALDKIRERRRRRSINERRDSDESSRGLSTLIPGRRRSRLRAEQDGSNGTLGASASQLNITLTGNQSVTSLDHHGSGSSSLFTDDNQSDVEGVPTRPAFSPHQSHIGYLTHSSPDISAVQTTAANGLISETNPSITSSAPSIPHIVEPDQDDGRTRVKQQDRSSSAVDKLRAKLSRKSSSTSLGSKSSVPTGNDDIEPASSRSSSVPPSLNAEPTSDAEVSQQNGAGASAAGRIEPSRPGTPQTNPLRPRISTADLPSTPPSVNPETPQTFVTPPTPTDPNIDAATFSKFPLTRISSPTRSLGGSKHRRSQSANVPSKLSQSIAPPLTPTLEEIKTPGGTLTTGFFSSFFSAAQKAADQFSLGGNNPGGPNARSRDIKSQTNPESGGEEVIPGSESQPVTSTVAAERRPRAIETLGKGNLDFSHLGISEAAVATSIMSNTEVAQTNTSAILTEANKAEEEAANRAVSAAYDKPLSAASVHVAQHSRPLSISSDRLTLGESTPPRGGDVDSLKRSGSVRSRLSGRRRHRASSATAGTSNSIGAALAASATGLANAGANGAGHRLTGFAVASSRRNKDFHQLFRSVPEDDYLIEDYSAALQRDILLHGRLYVSENHICFSSNILGWVTNLVISFDEVVSVEKKSTAVIFPNALVISTMQARNTFASLVARDSTYELIIGIWKITHPNLKSSLNGVTLDNAGTGDKTEVAEPDGSDDDDSESGSDDVYDEDADNDVGSFTDGGMAPSVAGSDVGAQSISRKPSNSAVGNTQPQASGATAKDVESAGTGTAAPSTNADFPGPSAHPPSQCADEHYDRPLIDTTISAPLGKVYNVMFGPASSAFMRKWLVEDQKSRELNYPEDKIGLDNEHKSFVFDYIKPLSAPVGPKQTKCITTSTVLAFDLEKAVTIDCSTSTPDVPSGNIFTTKTRYCLTWAPANSTRLVATCTIEWTGKSWLRAPIEKGANDGQIEYVKAIVAAITQVVATKSSPRATEKRGKKRSKKDAVDSDGSSAKREASIAAENKAPDWGLFQPMHALLSPIFALLRSFVSPHVVIAVLSILLIYTWLRPNATSSNSDLGLQRSTSAQRLAAYEEIWRREESQLWNWLEDRVGLDGGYAPGGADGQQKLLAAKRMRKRVEDEHMTERQMDDAIRITEERLEALKAAVERKKKS